MKIKTTTLDNKQGAEISLNQDIFGLDSTRVDILQRVVEWQRARKQAGTHSCKNRSEVSGTTKKPFKQKGTGNARQGSLKGPHQIGGGKAHGPQVRSHAYDLPKKFRKLGLKTALSLKAKEGKLRIFDSLSLEQAKTKDVVAKLDALGLNSVLFVRDSNTKDGFYKAVQNIPHKDVIPEFGLNVYDILKHDELAISTQASKNLEERLK